MFVWSLSLYNIIEVKVSFFYAKSRTCSFIVSNYIFVYPDGTQEIVYDNDIEPYALCTHSMVSGTYYVHDKLSSGGCKIKVYDAQKCKKCGYLANAVYKNTITYAVCPH